MGKESTGRRAADKGEPMLGNKEQALAALLTSTSMREAAGKCGLSERTLNEYVRTDPEFKKAYTAGRREIVRTAASEMQEAYLLAVNTLKEIAANKEHSAGVRIQAAGNILKYGIKLQEITDVSDRLDAIEERLDTWNRKH